MAEWRIGEIKQVNGEWYQCIESHSSCEGCDFKNTFKCSYAGTKCSFPVRQDHTSVIFKKLEKDGEPYYSKYFGKFYQKYITYIPAVGHNFKIRVEPVEHVGRNEIFIEIKQNKKEDMEIDKVVMNIDDRDYLLDRLEAILHDTHCQQYKDEICEAFSKYIVTETASGLKPFDLNAAKAGKPVCTRDGKKVKIICFDVKGSIHPIVALIEDGERERLCSYMPNGRRYEDEEWKDDLMMFPEKKSGWVIVSKNVTIYNNLEDAKKSFDLDKELCICKVEWEE